MIFSIVTPVFNVENYIEDCLISCISQDIPFDEYEAICVNDGSTDSSGEILERYVRKNPHISGFLFCLLPQTFDEVSAPSC